MFVEGKVLRKDEHNQFFGRIDDALRCSHAAPAEGAQCSQSPGQTVVDSNGDSQTKAVSGRENAISDRQSAEVISDQDSECFAAKDTAAVQLAAAAEHLAEKPVIIERGE